MNATRCFLIESPQACFTWIGEAQREGAFVWLCNPGGNRVLRVPAEFVRESTLEETARRIEADRRAKLAGRN